MLTDTHCIVIASARTGGPSVAGSITHTRANTAQARPTNQSPNRIHPARPASGTHFVITNRPSRTRLLPRRKHRPPAPFELRRRAVVSGGDRHCKAVLARGRAPVGVRQEVAEAVEESLEIWRGTHEPGAPVIDELG